jgi:hypothetical protein
MKKYEATETHNKKSAGGTFRRSYSSLRSAHTQSKILKTKNNIIGAII